MRFPLNDSRMKASDSAVSFLFHLPTTVLLALLVAGLVALPAAAIDFRFETENDFLTGGNEDDLYTFAVALEIDRGGFLWALREQAFTDRDRGVRFDETQFAVGRNLPAPAGWTAYGELGIMHLGEGLLGQDAQNALHSAIGDEEVHLEYVAEGDLHGTVYVRLDRLYRLSHDLTVGPRLEAFAAPGFRTGALAAIQVHWSPWQSIGTHVMVGGRLSDSSLEHLDPYLEPSELAAELGIVLRDRILLSWSYNEHGTGREHFALGYRFGSLGGVGSPGRPTD